MNTKSFDHGPRLAEGAEKALKTLGFDVDEPSSREPVESVQPVQRQRSKWSTPTILLICSIASMAWAGLTTWAPVQVLELAYQQNSFFELRRMVLANWSQGLTFSVSLTIILGAHELGHYFVTRWYGIRSTPPLFIPFPLSPIGTCGAVIMMEGNRADRKQIFDIGIAGPLAGMVMAIPIAVFGMCFSMPLHSTGGPSVYFGQPLIVQCLSYLFSPGMQWESHGLANTAITPMLMAAWVGFLITGVNMIPVSQLDGGHVIFGIMGRQSKWINWTAYGACLGFVLYQQLVNHVPLFVVLLILVALMGLSHPPSRNDLVKLGVWRIVLGWISLSLPLLCVPLNPILIAS